MGLEDSQSEPCAVSIGTVKLTTFWPYHTSQTCFHGQEGKQGGEGKCPWLSGRHTNKQVERTGITVSVPVAGLIPSASTPPLHNIYEVTKKFQASGQFWGFQELYYEVWLSTGSLHRASLYIMSYSGTLVSAHDASRQLLKYFLIWSCWPFLNSMKYKH